VKSVVKTSCLTNLFAGGNIYEILDTFQERLLKTCVVLPKSAALGSTPALIALAPRPTGWTTFSADPQRTGWAKSETVSEMFVSR